LDVSFGGTDRRSVGRARPPTNGGGVPSATRAYKFAIIAGNSIGKSLFADSFFKNPIGLFSPRA
jgi:hypothetical protein